MADADADAALARLYQPRIREHAARVRRDKRLAHPDVTASCRSPVCGSTVTLDLMLDDGIVTELGWKGRACTLGMASLGIVARAAIGQNAHQISEVRRRLADLLDGRETDFPPGWEALALFSAAREFPSRFGSVLLPFDALDRGFSQLDHQPG